MMSLDFFAVPLSSPITTGCPISGSPTRSRRTRR
jgi:hypothetical protein